MQQIKDALPLANKFLNFVNASRSPWHAVDSVRKQLLAKGYVLLQEKESWKLQPNGKYFFTRNGSSIVAFAVGGGFKPGNGFKIVGAHTDSPDLKLKPVSCQEKLGYLQVGVQTYGGGLWYTWFDRDLTVAGRAIVKNEKNQSFSHQLVQLSKPILRIPSLAIHLDREVNDKGFAPNKESNLLPIICTAVKDQLGVKQTVGDNADGLEKSHHPLLLELLANELNCNVSDIKDLELSIVDSQPASLGGAYDEFIFSPRIDNLLSCFCALEALFDSEHSLDKDSDVRVIALFDHEEVGSESAQGAGSNLVNDLVKRINAVLTTKETMADANESCIHKSFLISIDMAHALHPNYAERHQEKHRPMMHKGIVIKANCNQRYATNAVSSFVMKELAKRNSIPYQEFVVRNDTGCGSTIGPILAAKCGVRTVDIGIPQLSMHSIREMCGVADVSHGARLLTAFFNQFREVDQSLQVD